MVDWDKSFCRNWLIGYPKQKQQVKTKLTMRIIKSVLIFETCESRSWYLHEHPCLWLACDVEENVVVAGVHVWSLQAWPTYQGHLTLLGLNQNVCDEKRRTVVLWQYFDRELVLSLMVVVGNAENDEILDRVTVVVMVTNQTCLNVTDGKGEALLTWIQWDRDKKSSHQLLGHFRTFF